MSDVTALFEGKLTPAQFVVKAAGDIKKDVVFFQGLPFASTLEEWALNALRTLLSSKLSPILAALIVNEIKQVLGLVPAVPQAPTPGIPSGQ